MPLLIRNVVSIILYIFVSSCNGFIPSDSKQGPASNGFALQEASKIAAKPKERGPTPCEQSRRDLLKQMEGRQSSSTVYLPQCDMRDESLYRRLQCHGKAMCWCVDIITGDPVIDECEGSTATVEIHNVGSLSKKRDIKRCTKPEKIAKFYKKLFVTFIEEQASQDPFIIDSTSISLKETKQRAKIQQAVLWRFKSLDKNGNNILERFEWRSYRKAIRMWQGVRTCARNFFRFCDMDLNRKITPEEWRDCTFPNIGFALVEKSPPVNPFMTGLLIEDRHS